MNIRFTQVAKATISVALSCAMMTVAIPSYAKTMDDAGTSTTASESAVESTGATSTDVITTQSTDIASGTWGTCAWVINGDGVLTVSAGTGTDVYSHTQTPWVDNITDITSVTTNGTVVLPASAAALFYGATNMTSFGGSWDTSNTTNISSFFSQDTHLTSVDLSSFNTSNVTDMNMMFARCLRLPSISFPTTFDTSNVTDMSQMFFGCEAMGDIALPACFNTAKVTNTAMMFYDCQTAKTITLSENFTTGANTNASNMFGRCYALTKITFLTPFTMAATHVNTFPIPTTSYSGFTSTGKWVAGSEIATTTAYTFDELSDLSSLSGSWYAQADGTFYTVTYHSNDDAAETSSQVVKADTDTALTANGFANGSKEFLGWATSADGAVVYTDSATVNNLAVANGNADLYAVWSEPTPTTYTITFNANNGSAATASQTADVDTNVALTANAFTNGTKVFKGWATSADGAVVYTDGQTVKNLATAGSSITLYAVWAEPVSGSYTITFNANDGSAATASQTADVVANVALTANAFTNGTKVFKGWATSADGAVVYTDGQTVKNLATAGSSITLYAVWAEPDPVTPPAPTDPTDPTTPGTTPTADGTDTAGTTNTAAVTATSGELPKTGDNVVLPIAIGSLLVLGFGCVAFAYRKHRIAEN